MTISTNIDLDFWVPVVLFVPVIILFLYIVIFFTASQVYVSNVADKVVKLNNQQKYHEAVEKSEHITIMFAPDRDYRYSSFSKAGKLALANSYIKIGDEEQAISVYLNILGYTDEDYQAMQYLTGDVSIDSLQELAIYK